MRQGFKYNGRHTSELGVMSKTVSRPIMPEQRRLTFEAAGIDGVLDLSADNDYKRAMYNEREFAVDLTVIASSSMELQSKLSSVAKWLSEPGVLEFDDNPAVLWNARVVKQIDYCPKHQGCVAILRIYFSAKPFSYAEFNVGDPITIGMRIPIGTPIEIGGGSYVYDISSDITNISVNNFGTAPVRPRFTLHGTYAYTIQANGLTFKIYTNDLIGVTVDGEKCTVTGQNDGFDGVFPELAPGENNITITRDAYTSETETNPIHVIADNTISSNVFTVKSSMSEILSFDIPETPEGASIKSAVLRLTTYKCNRSGFAINISNKKTGEKIITDTRVEAGANSYAIDSGWAYVNVSGHRDISNWQTNISMPVSTITPGEKLDLKISSESDGNVVFFSPSQRDLSISYGNISGTHSSEDLIPMLIITYQIEDSSKQNTIEFGFVPRFYWGWNV